MPEKQATSSAHGTIRQEYQRKYYDGLDIDGLTCTVEGPALIPAALICCSRRDIRATCRAKISPCNNNLFRPQLSNKRKAPKIYSVYRKSGCFSPSFSCSSCDSARRWSRFPASRALFS